MSDPSSATGEIVFLPQDEVERRVGLSRATIYRMISANQFPKQINISDRRVAWLESDIVAWQMEKLREAGRA